MSWPPSTKSGTATVPEDAPSPGHGAGRDTLETALRIGPALPADALELLRWRNDPLVRAMSRSGQPIPEEAHLAWYTATGRDPARLLLIGRCDGAAIGAVRFDRNAPAVWEVSILLAPEARGRRLGRGLLAAALTHLKSCHGPALVMAEVRESNIASIRLFESLGFMPTATEAGFRRYRWPCAADPVASGETPSHSFQRGSPGIVV